MTKILSIHSFRRGTGKSNLTANIAVQLARKGKRGAVIDANLTSPGIHTLFGLQEGDINKTLNTLNDYLQGQCSIKDTALDVSFKIPRAHLAPKTLFLVPSSTRFAEIAHILRHGYDGDRLNTGFQTLGKELALDYIFVDTHPGLTEETLFQIALSDMLILVMRPDQQDFQGTAVMVDLARKLDIPDLFLVINNVVSSYDSQSLKTKVEQTYHATVTAIIPLSEDVASLQSSDIFSLVFEQHPATDAVHQIVNAIESVSR